MKLNAHFGICGDYKLRILDGKTRAIKYESPDWIPNLITNLGMDRVGLGSGAAWANFCRIGTGTTTPAFTDTALVAQVASTSTLVGSVSNVNAGAPNYETTSTATWEFAQGAVVGNMAELGLGWTASTANTLATRSRILDGGGSPTTITVQASEILQVTYRLRSFPKITDDTGVVVISGVNYNYTARLSSAGNARGLQATNGPLTGLSSANAYNGALGAITAAPSGTTTSLTTGALAAYTNGNFYREHTVTAALAVGNLSGGITAISMSYLGGASGTWATHQIGFSPAIPKDNTKTLSLTFRTSWARH